MSTTSSLFGFNNLLSNQALGNFVDYVGTSLHLPEFGISEALAQEPTTNTAVFGTSTGSSQNQPVNQTLYTDPYRNITTTNSNIGPIANPTGTNPTPSGNTTTSGGGGGDSLLTQLLKMQASGGLNPEQQRQFDEIINAQKNSQSAQLAAANTEFDRNRAELENQLTGLGSQKENALNEIETGLSGVRNQVGSSRANAQANTDQQVRQAGSIAHSTQDQNRRVLRALGIINSSAAGELLTKPINEFDKQRGNLQEALGRRFNELDDFLNQKVAESNDAKNSIISQYTNAYNAIQTDLRFNDRQRLDAIQAINAQAQQHLADIQSQILNYKQQVDTQKQNFALGLAQIAAYQNPTIASDYLNNFLLSNTGAGQSVTGNLQALVNPQKKDTLSGL